MVIGVDSVVDPEGVLEAVPEEEAIMARDHSEEEEAEDKVAVNTRFRRVHSFLCI